MEKKFRLLPLVISISLFAFFLYRNYAINIKKVQAVPGELNFGTTTATQIQYMKQKVIYQDDLYFGAAAFPGMITSQGYVMVGTTGAPTSGYLLNVTNGRIKGDGVSIGTTANNYQLEIAGNGGYAARIDGNVGIGNGVVGQGASSAFDVPLTVKGPTPAAGPVNMIKMYDGTNTTNVGYTTSSLTVDKAFTSSGLGKSSFAGSLGIGTTDPSQLLEIKGPIANTPSLRITGNDTASSAYLQVGPNITDLGSVGARVALIDAGTSGVRWDLTNGGVAPGALTFRQNTGGVNAMTIASNGNVGVGMTNPAARMDIGGTSSLIQNTSGNLNITPANNLTITQGNVGIGTPAGSNKLFVSNTLAGQNYVQSLFNGGSPAANANCGAGGYCNAKVVGGTLNVSGNGISNLSTPTGYLGFFHGSDGAVGSLYDATIAGVAGVTVNHTTSTTYADNPTGVFGQVGHDNASALTIGDGPTFAHTEYVSSLRGDTYGAWNVNGSMNAGSRYYISSVAGLTHTSGGATSYGGYFNNYGSATTQIGLYSTATGGTSNYAALFDQGNVGIGTMTPSYKLDVNGEIHSRSRVSAEASSDVGGAISIENNNKTTAAQTKQWVLWNMTGGYGDGLNFWRYAGDGSNPGPTFKLYDNGNSYFTGSVGIGSASPGYKLDVNGPVRALGSSVFAQSDNSTLNYAAAPIQLREAQYGASISYLPPRLSFHWGGVVASQLALESDGSIAVRNNPGTGYEKIKSSADYSGVFYDLNDSTYYVDPNSSGIAANLYGSLSLGSYTINGRIGTTYWRSWPASFITTADDSFVNETLFHSDYFITMRTNGGGIRMLDGVDGGSFSEMANFSAYYDWITFSYPVTFGYSMSATGVAFKHSCCAPDSWFRMVQDSNRSVYHGLAVGPFYANGAVRFDLAEITPVDPSENLILGEIVSPNRDKDTVQLHRSREANDPTVVGIVSDVNTASMTIGGDVGPEQASTVIDRKPIALGGRVTTIVNLENGPIKTGDSITTSSAPGRGMKAVRAGSVVSKALEPFDGSRTNSAGVEDILTKLKKELADSKDNTTTTSIKKTIAMMTAPLPKGTGRIITFVSVSQYDPDMYLTGTGDLHITQKSDSEFELRDKNSLLSRIGAFAQIVVAKIQAGIIEAKKIIINGTDIGQYMKETNDKIKSMQDVINKQNVRIEELEKKVNGNTQYAQ